MLYFVKTFLLKEKLMADKYRVICTENQRLYPGKTFIDIYPAGSLRPENSLTHDCLLQMRRLATPEVDKLESGIILTDFGNGSIHLQYETMPNRRMKEYQNLLRQRLDKQIIDTFKQMRAKGFDRTLEISFTEMAARFDLYASEDDTPVSARQDALIKENARQKRLAEKHKEAVRRAAASRYAASPEILLAWRQAKYRGD